MADPGTGTYITYNRIHIGEARRQYICWGREGAKIGGGTLFHSFLKILLNFIGS
jgi:hypothetical protein